MRKWSRCGRLLTSLSVELKFCFHTVQVPNAVQRIRWLLPCQTTSAEMMAVHERYWAIIESKATSLNSPCHLHFLAASHRQIHRLSCFIASPIAPLFPIQFGWCVKQLLQRAIYPLENRMERKNGPIWYVVEKFRRTTIGNICVAITHTCPTLEA